MKVFMGERGDFGLLSCGRALRFLALITWTRGASSSAVAAIDYRCLYPTKCLPKTLRLRLSEDSQRLITISTHRGLYKYERLVFGLKTVPVISQSAIEQALSGLEGVFVYLDNILVLAPDDVSHSERLRTVLARLESWGFRLRLEICTFV